MNIDTRGIVLTAAGMAMMAVGAFGLWISADRHPVSGILTALDPYGLNSIFMGIANMAGNPLGSWTSQNFELTPESLTTCILSTMICIGGLWAISNGVKKATKHREKRNQDAKPD